MSRSLGYRARHKKQQATTSPQGEGAAAFGAGKPITANPYYGPGRGKAHAWAKGWRRARMKAQR